MVIGQQQKSYPEQQWHVMDVTNMTFADHHFHLAIDKSLIDTLLCYASSNINTSKMIDEIYRVMAPGSRYLLTPYAVGQSLTNYLSLGISRFLFIL